MLKLKDQLAGKTIHETKSFSTDSYANILKLKKKLPFEEAGFVPLNSSNKANNFLDDLVTKNSKEWSASANFKSEEAAIEGAKRMDDYMLKLGETTKSKVVNNNGKFEVHVPNYKIKVPEVNTTFKELPGSPNANKVDAADYMSLEAPKGNMYGENQVQVQQSRLLNPEIKAKFFEHQAPLVEPDFSKKGLFESKFVKIPKDYGNRITPENYEDFVKNVHGSTDYGIAEPTGFRPGNLGLGNYGKPGMVFSDAPLNNLGKDIINAHEKNHGMFSGTVSKEQKNNLLKPFGTNKPIPKYGTSEQADEVLARMGQFKNAVGIGDNQTFTLGHLNLIRKNYAKSFLDNGITEMLAKIKPGSLGEKEFLKNMNKYAYGIGALATLGTAGALPEKKRGGWLDNYQK